MDDDDNENENKDEKYKNFYNSNDNNITSSSISFNNSPFSSGIEPISKINYSYHYSCPKCHKFPFIEFSKNHKDIKYICSCIKNKILLGEKNIFNKTSIENFIENCPTIIDNEIGLCKEHTQKFEYFCMTCLINICKKCMPEHNCKPHNLISFKDIEIDKEKLDQLIKITNEKISSEKGMTSNAISNEKENIKLISINNKLSEKLSEKEEYYFYQLINIIINNYQKYPNFVHFFNIENIFRFLNINKQKKNEKENIKENNELSEEEGIIIEYANNINDKTKLFSKKFVENNKGKVNLLIEGELLELEKEYYYFKSKEKYVTITLKIKDNIYEIDMSKIFSNCYNLISLSGISKWKKINIINMSKMFYNCISLSSIPDISDWDISKVNDYYLMFYNCISLIFLSNLDNINLDKFNEKNKNLLGITLTKYFNINNEITIKNMLVDNDYINLFGNKYEIKNINENIILINGNKNELIACYKKEINSDINKLNIFYKNNIKNKGKEIEIKIIIINKFVNMSNIIESSILDLSKWITNNVSDMSYMFYNCSSLSSLPDISKWNTNNVSDMSYMFYNCSLLKSLPDISKWNTNNVTDISYMFYNCSSLSSLPDLSKWNTGNITHVKYMFYKCSLLICLPDLSKWIINNITDISYLFYNCSLLKSLPDLSKWNSDKIINMKCIFFGCKSLFDLPDLSKWITNNVIDMSYHFL